MSLFVLYSICEIYLTLGYASDCKVQVFLSDMIFLACNAIDGVPEEVVMVLIRIELRAYGYLIPFGQQTLGKLQVKCVTWPV